ncbi:MAG: DUF1850 domain-containing protein [Oscillospiraceae bacterium]|nr:DUF1850 domain-containing protein [Oscillospiraceae bacterium]
MMAAAAILVVAAAAILAVFLLREPKLILSNDETGKIYARLPLRNGDSFSVTFRHSVNKSDVTEIYQRRGREIWLTGCVYYGFGAGVAEVLEPGWTLETGDNGEMIIGSIEMKMNDLTYIVGTVYDHILEINGERIVLNDLCGKNAKVHFSIK